MAKESDKLAKQCLANSPGADGALAEYLLKILPVWIRGSFSRLTPQDVDELTSLGTIHVLANIKKFNGRSSFDTWARKVVSNKIRDWLAERARRWKRETSIDAENPVTGGSLADILPTRLLNPREEADRTIGREIAMAVLERVKNSRQKLILTEHFVGGLSVAEIAERWGEKRRNKLDVLLCQAMQTFFKLVKEMRQEGRLEKCSARVLRK